MALDPQFVEVSFDLDRSGLVWHPEIGDEVAVRAKLHQISIIVDPQGLTPHELREQYLWLPTVEQLVHQFEARQAFIYHAGITTALLYETVIRTNEGVIETKAPTLRVAFGRALHELINHKSTDSIH